MPPPRPGWPGNKPGTVSAQVDFVNPRPRRSGDLTQRTARTGTAFPHSQHPLGGSGRVPWVTEKETEAPPSEGLAKVMHSQRAAGPRASSELWVWRRARGNSSKRPLGTRPNPGSEGEAEAVLPGAADTAEWPRCLSSSSFTRACWSLAPQLGWRGWPEPRAPCPHPLPGLRP